MKILITGGAGFVTSVGVEKLLDKEYEFVVHGSLIKAHRDAVKEISRKDFKQELKEIFKWFKENL